jgi:hypothetical protein
MRAGVCLFPMLCLCVFACACIAASAVPAAFSLLLCVTSRLSTCRFGKGSRESRARAQEEREGGGNEDSPVLTGARDEGCVQRTAAQSLPTHAASQRKPLQQRNQHVTRCAAQGRTDGACLPHIKTLCSPSQRPFFSFLSSRAHPGAVVLPLAPLTGRTLFSPACFVALASIESGSTRHR